MPNTHAPRRSPKKISASAQWRRYTRLTAACVEAMEPRVLLSALNFSGATYNLAVPTGASVVADLGNGHGDIVTVNENGTISIMLGNGNGTFRPQTVLSDDLPDDANGVDSLVVADLGNGNPDILVTNDQAYGQISVFIGNGDGTFQSPVFVSATDGASVDQMVVATLGNGNPGVVTANDDGTVSVIPGEGDGEFGHLNVYSVSDFALNSVAVADINGDGLPDIIASSQGDGTVSVLVGNGGGYYNAQVIAGAGSNAESFAVADLGNGKQDLVVLNSDLSVSVLLNNGGGTFAPAQVLTTGISASNHKVGSLALADVNGDGKLDIAYGYDNAGQGLPGQLAVFLNKGNGVFGTTAIVSTSTQASPGNFALGDVNNNSKADLVVLYPGQITVQLGNGNGTFGAATTYPLLQENPSDMAIANLTDRGEGGGLDIVTAEPDGTVTILFSNGDGTFGKPEIISDGLQYGPAEVVVGDFSSNSTPDIVVSNGGTRISVLVSNGDGTFEVPTSYVMSANVGAMAIGDFFGDGEPDLAVGLDTGMVQIMFGAANGNSEVFSGSQQIYVSGQSPITALSVGDVNNDGIPDLMVGEANGVLYEVQGNGTRSFTAAIPIYNASSSFGILEGDLLGNGNEDLILTQANGQLDVLVGNGNGIFQPPTIITLNNNIVGTAALADLNGDGIPDLVISTYYTNKVQVFLGNGNGTFQPPQNLTVGNGPDHVSVSDLIGDGQLDIVAANRKDGSVTVLLNENAGIHGNLFGAAKNFGSGDRPRGVAIYAISNTESMIAVANSHDDTVQVYLSNGNGTFSVTHTYGGFNSPYAVALADVNGDGQPDLIVGENYGGGVVAVMLSNANGTFRPKINAFFLTAASVDGCDNGQIAIVATDVNGDGKPDIIATNYYNNTVNVLLNNNDQGFEPLQSYAVGNDPGSLAVGPLILGNNSPDIVVGNLYSASVSVLLNNGGGTFLPAQNFFAGPYPQSVAIGDVTGDGKPDIVVAGESSQYTGNGAEVSVLAGNGNGTFQQPNSMELPGNRAGGVAVADLNGNGKQDLIVASGFQDAPIDTVDVFLGNGDGTFQQSFNYSVLTGPEFLAVGDINGDNRPDIVVNDDQFNEITVFLSSGGLGFTSSSTAVFTAGVATSYLVSTNGPSTTTFKETGALPGGITLTSNGNGTASLHGTAAAAANGTFVVTITATSGLTKATQVFTLTVDQGSSFTSKNSATFTVGTTGTFTVVTGGFPAGGSVSEVGDTLPIGVVFTDNGNGTATLSGDPAVGTGGIYNLTFSSANGVNSQPALQTFTLTVDQPPSFINTAVVNAPVFHTVGGVVSGIAVADVLGNGTGNPADIVTANNNGTVTILFGNGDGTFQAPVTIPDGLSPDTSEGPDGVVVVADLGNGHPDLLVSDGNDGNAVSILLGNGSGMFSPPILTTVDPTAGVGVEYMAVANLGNGAQDLVTINGDGTASVLLGNGSGTFSPANLYTIGNSVNSLALADVNGDGHPDIVTVNVANGTVDVLYGVGTGAFNVAAVSIPAAGNNAYDVQSADFGNGNTSDLATINTSGVVSVLLNNGSGNLSVSQTLNTGLRPASGYRSFLSLADVNGDGLPDLVVIQGTSPTSAKIDVFLANGIGTFDSTPFVITNKNSPTHVGAGDINGDGMADLIFGYNGKVGVRLSANSATSSATLNAGTFGAVTIATGGLPVAKLTESGALPAGVHFTDNGDGTASISGVAAANAGKTYTVTITANNGISPSAVQAFTLTVDQAPLITTTTQPTFVAGAANPSTFTFNASGFPAPTISLIGGTLPVNLTFNAGTGSATITGTAALGTGGTYTLTLDTGNGVGTDSIQVFTVSVPQPPLITSGAADTFQTGVTNSFLVTTTGTPTPVMSEVGALPLGLHFVDNHDGTAMIYGTAGPTTGKTYVLTLGASNGIGSKNTQVFTLTVDQPAAITSANHFTMTTDKAATFTVTTSGFPNGGGITLSDGTSLLPSGVTFVDNGNGTATLAGMPAMTSGGFYQLTLTANNGISGGSPQSFTLSVYQPPSISTTNNFTMTTDVAGTFNVQTAGFPTPLFLLPGVLPHGVSFTDNHNGTATIAGTPAAGTGKNYGLGLIILNVAGHFTQGFNLIVDQSPAITNRVTNLTLHAGSASTFPIAITGYPLSTVTEIGGLPNGINLASSRTGVPELAGMPTAGSGGVYTVTITANNGVSPQASQTFTLTVGETPAFTSAKTATFTVGTPGNFTVTTDGSPISALSEIGALPSGLTFTDNDNDTATLAGTAASGTAGTYLLTLAANSGASAKVTQKFMLIVS